MKLSAVALLVVAFGAAGVAHAGVAKQAFTKGGASTAFDLHVVTSAAVAAVTVVDQNGNTLANPGPFAAPPAGLGTNNLTFSGGVPGSVAPGATAPTQPGAGVNLYQFDTGAAGGIKVQKWWWTDPNGAKLAMVANDCGVPAQGIAGTLDPTDNTCDGIDHDTPTLSEWGMIALVGLLAVAGAFLLLR